MNKKVIVVEDFYDNPHEVRKYALGCNYYPPYGDGFGGGDGQGNITLATAMSTGHHTVHCTSSDENAHASSEASHHTTTAYRIFSKNSSHALTDTAAQYGTVFGDLA